MNKSKVKKSFKKVVDTSFVLGFFAGQVLKMTGGKANPSVVNELVVQKLSK